MVCHEFKGGIGTASRVLAADAGGWTVGVLVQANYGERDQLRIDGVPIGERHPGRRGADALRRRRRAVEAGAGSIIVVVATDAPLLPHQCTRIAQRASLGLARMGSTANHSSGDLILAFATGNRGLSMTDEPGVHVPAARSTSGWSPTTG